MHLCVLGLPFCNGGVRNTIVAACLFLSRVTTVAATDYGINVQNIQKLQHVQNAAARLISRRCKRKSVRDVLTTLHWLPVEERIIFKLLTLTFKCFHKTAPQCLIELIKVNSAAEFTLHYVYLDSCYGRRSFKYCAPRYWNALPFNIRSCCNLDTFKKLTKTYLFNNFYILKKTAFKYN